MGTTVETLVEKLGLMPHPEGGFYRETYRSKYSTAIYFLLTPGGFSAFHRIRSDEVWHFYSGDPITIVEIDNDGGTKRTVLGRGDPQYVVPAGNWFASYLNEGGTFGLVGCTVAPAFEFKDFELAKRDELLNKYPKAKEEIVRLTRV